MCNMKWNEKLTNCFATTYKLYDIQIANQTNNNNSNKAQTDLILINLMRACFNVT